MEKIIELNGCATPVTVSGEGPVLVLLHGGPGSFDYLDGLAALLPAGLKLIRYDQRGGGRSGREGPFTVAQLVDDLEQLRVQLGLDTWHVLGHSWGAFLGLAYAAAHPQRVSSLLHLNGSGIDPDWQKAYHLNRRKKLKPAEQIEFLHLRQERESACDGKRAGIERRLLELNLRADFHDPEKLGDLPVRLMSCPVNPEASAALLADWQRLLLDPDWRRGVAALNMPVCCVHGSADPRPETGARTLGELLPQGRFVSLADCGHYPWLERPGALETVLAEWIQSL